MDYDLYLDPKNDFLIEKDKSKITLVQSQNNVNVIVMSKDNISNDFIASLCSLSQNRTVICPLPKDCNKPLYE